MDSDSGSEASDQSEVDPAHAAIAASLVLLLAAAIQAIKTLRALRNRRQPKTLEELVLECIDNESVSFIKMKNFFRMMAGPLLEKICRRECRSLHRPRVARALMNPRTRHLCIDAERPSTYNDVPEAERWTLQDLEALCEDVVREGKTSLLSLEIRNFNKPTPITHPALCPGLHSTQVASMLLGLRALTSLKLVGFCSFQTYEVDLLVSVLASTNRDIRSLELPFLSNKSLRTIADHWPQLESLQCPVHEFDNSCLEAVLPRLRNLRDLGIYDRTISQTMMSVARAHDPASPPYKLSLSCFTCSSINPLTSDDLIKLFTAFPELYCLKLRETDIPAVCAALEGREHVHITDLTMEPNSANPPALEPLLARLGQQLKDITYDFSENRVDLNMIGHYCPNLEGLTINAGELVSGDEFEVTEAFFSKLEVCDVSHTSTHLPNASLPPALVCSLMAGPNLNDFWSRGVPLTEEVVAALVEQRERGALDSLYSLGVWYEPSLNVRVLAEIATHAPNLKLIDLATERPEEEEEEGEEDEGLLEMEGVLTSFMHQSELDIYVDIKKY